jgi:HPt (histidine-containing phosphotransfer) domain-containing protein
MTEDAAAEIAARLTELWRTSRPTVFERVNLLRSAFDSLAENPADEEARATGREAAHKLSGVLGVFGLPQGSEIAASVEHLLKSTEPLTADDLSGLRQHIADLDAVITSKPER